MKLSDLRRPHAEYDLALFHRHKDLFEGGKSLRSRLSSYLPQHPAEPSELYKSRLTSATYINYCAPIVNYFASWLFTSPPDCRPSPEAPWFAGFRDNCNERGTDFAWFLRERFVEALLHQRSYWRVEAPERAERLSAAEVEAQGLNKVHLCPVPITSVVNWLSADDGELQWLLEHRCSTSLESLFDASSTTRETWTLWSRDEAPKQWTAVYAEDKPPQQDAELPEEPGPTSRKGIPFVVLELPPELWVLNLISDPQLELFRKRNALSWAIDRSCFSMPVVFTASKKQVQAMGAGYFLQLGKDDRFEWPAPPSAPFATIETNAEKLKDELFRVAHQMAQGVSNNAAAVGRSADSKAQDAAATEIVLQAFGSVLREPIKQTLSIASALRGERTEWTVAGLDTYNMVDGKTLAETLLTLDPLQIPSASFRREALATLTDSVLPRASEELRAKIRQELEAGVPHEPSP